MKKVTEEFLEELIKRNVDTTKIRNSRTGAMIERETVNVKQIVKEVMEALRTKRKAAVKKPKKKKVK